MLCIKVNTKISFALSPIPGIILHEPQSSGLFLENSALTRPRCLAVYHRFIMQPDAIHLLSTSKVLHLISFFLLWEVAQCKSDHFRSGQSVSLTAVAPSVTVSIIQSSFSKVLHCKNTSFHFRCTSCLSFGDGHALRHSFDGNSFVAHFDMNKKCGRGQTGPICLQEVNVSIT